MTSLFCKIREPTRKPAEFIGDNSESGARKASSDRRSNLEVVRSKDAKPDEADGRKKSNESSLTILETDNEVKRRGLKETISRRDKHKKQKRAYGGCLGFRRRRRTWKAAKSSGELQTGIDPEISEWGNPPV